MGLLDFFIRRKRRTTKKRKSKGPNILRQQIAGIQGQVDSINSILQNHQKDIDENSVLLKEHSQKLTNLEDILTNLPMSLPPSQTSSIQRPDWTAKPIQPNGIHSCKFDINKFSNQEKRILSVFFEHQDMSLSYKDVGSMLGKSANTIKNQMHQILIKADLFERIVDNDMRNRFRLKDGIKIEKYLNIGRPSNQPVGTERLSQACYRPVVLK
jgi:hypothetical protein